GGARSIAKFHAYYTPHRRAAAVGRGPDWIKIRHRRTLRAMANRITRSVPIDVLFVIVPDALLLDIAGAAEALRLVNLRCAQRNQPPRFRLRFAGPVTQMRASVGVTLAALEPLPSALEAPTWVVVPGQPSAQLRHVTKPIIDTARWLNSTLRAAILGPAGRPPEVRDRLVTI